MITKKSLLLLAAAGLLVAGLFALSRTQREEAPAPRQAAEAKLFPFVRSLAGTTIDGNIATTSGDELAVSAELRRMFDYYLSTVGEKSLDAIRTEIENELERELKPGAARAAKDLLGRYLAYKRALAEVEKNTQVAGNSAASPQGRYAAMQQVRARYFSEKENRAMFGFDDAYDSDALARLEISQGKILSGAQKKQKLAALDAAMPAALREEKEAPFAVVRLEEKANALRAQGASEDEIYRMRAAAVSPEAAARLADVDREDALWKSRITAYQAARSQVLHSNANDQQAVLQQLQQLRESQFSAAEQKRLAAYE